MKDDDIEIGDSVIKANGDYVYTGTVVSIVVKLNGTRRYVVEDNRGLLFIFNASQLAPHIKDKP